MPSYETRGASIYIDSKKVAEANEGSLDIEGGDAQLFIDASEDGGFGGFSNGVITCTLNFTKLQPTAGSTVDILDILLKKKNPNIAVSLIDGKIIQIPRMRCMKGSTKWTHRDGTQNGEYSFSGGKPRPTG